MTNDKNLQVQRSQSDGNFEDHRIQPQFLSPDFLPQIEGIFLRSTRIFRLSNLANPQFNLDKERKWPPDFQVIEVNFLLLFPQVSSGNDFQASSKLPKFALSSSGGGPYCLLIAFPVPTKTTLQTSVLPPPLGCTGGGSFRHLGGGHHA